MRHTLLALSVVIVARAGAAQTPPPAAQPQPAPAPGAPATSAPAPPAAYTYNPEGRRDPFVSLLGRGTDMKQTGARAPGLPGLLIAEVTVTGILRDRSGFIAMVQAPDNKTYIIRGGDKLMDGAVKSITNEGVVFTQDVNDPLSLVKQREISKRVRTAETRG